MCTDPGFSTQHQLVLFCVNKYIFRRAHMVKSRKHASRVIRHPVIANRPAFAQAQNANRSVLAQPRPNATTHWTCMDTHHRHQTVINPLQQSQKKSQNQVAFQVAKTQPVQRASHRVQRVQLNCILMKNHLNLR